MVNNPGATGKLDVRFKMFALLNLTTATAKLKPSSDVNEHTMSRSLSDRVGSFAPV
jgi:hypothetical protein